MHPIALIALLIAGWLTVAASMLWGMLRVAKRHAAQATIPPTPQLPAATPPPPAPHPRLAL